MFPFHNKNMFSHCLMSFVLFILFLVGKYYAIRCPNNAQTKTEDLYVIKKINTLLYLRHAD